MPIVVNTNIASLNAQRNLNKTQSLLQRSLQRLSSGLRINSAKDDAAGLAISTRMTAQIRGLNQAIRNANNGISMLQTAEGALDEVTNMLQRIRELAVQAANDDATDADRASLQLEVKQRIEEINRIANTTSFSGIKLLDGSLTKAEFQVGANSNEVIEAKFSAIQAYKLGATGGTQTGEFGLVSVTNSGPGIGKPANAGSLIALEDGDLVINGYEIRGTRAADDPYSTTDHAASAIALAAAINEYAEKTGVRAVVNQAEVSFGITAGTDNLEAGDLVINGVNVGAVTVNGVSAVTVAQNLVKAINNVSDSTGVMAEYTSTGNTTVPYKITLKSIDGRNIEIEATLGAGEDVFATDSGLSNVYNIDNGDNLVIRGSVTLRSQKDITISGPGPNIAGFSEGVYEADTAFTSTEFTSSTFGIDNGDITITVGDVGYTLTDITTSDAYWNIDEDASTSEVFLTVSATSGGVASDAWSAVAIAHKINNTEGLKDVVKATAYTKVDLGRVNAVDASSSDPIIFEINGVTVRVQANIEADDSTGVLVGAINNAIQQQVASGTYRLAGIRAYMEEQSDGTSHLIIEAKYGQNIRLQFSGTASDGSTTLDTNNVDLFTHDGVDTTTSNAYYFKGTVALESLTGDPISISGNDATVGGFDEADFGTVQSIDISTKAGAQKAIDIIDEALQQISDIRSQFGAVMNRLESTVANLGNVAENLSAARSRILDADFAAETAELTRAQILQQAGTAMLAQANMLPQAALSLLQG
ncbi:flagellin N-terminal helical domain-containing protein [Thermosulfuriphilus sp.]